MRTIDHTHDPEARSWLASANDPTGDFPVQNLPFGVFRRAGSSEAFRGGTAIGDQIIDLAALGKSGLLGDIDSAAAQSAIACGGPVLNSFIALGPAAWRSLRHALFAVLASDQRPSSWPEEALVPQAQAEFTVPTSIGDYTDFYTSIYHAINIGKLFGAPDVTPNFRWLPIGYHGRSSSVGVSGQQVRRPLGQTRAPGEEKPTFGPSRWLDFELELGLFVGADNLLGMPVPISQAEQQLFGVCLLNDWSARDIQGWEMAPLGPFLAKNFATTISPWIVTMEALAPYRCSFERPAGEPQPLPYLIDDDQRRAGHLDIRLEVALRTEARRAAGLPAVPISRTSFHHQYWTPAQMLTHHTEGGCNLQVGDLLGTGTISGPTAGEAGALMELAQAGRAPIRLPVGPGETEQRGFLEDGDDVILRGWCEAEGRARIGFGECRGTILPSLSGILCVRHSMTNRSMYAEQEDDEGGSGRSGGDAVDSQGTD